VTGPIGGTSRHNGSAQERSTDLSAKEGGQIHIEAVTGRVGMTGTAFFAAYADVVVGSFVVTFDHLAGEGAGA